MPAVTLEECLSFINADKQNFHHKYTNNMQIMHYEIDVKIIQYLTVPKGIFRNSRVRVN